MTTRIALITGAATGIGAACAERLARDGHHAVLGDVDLARAEERAAALREEGLAATAIRLDVTDETSVHDCFAAIVRDLGSLDILVNNAGIAGTAADVAEYDFAEWRRVVAVDLDGVFLCCREAVPHMLETGWGRIVNIASIAGKEGNPRMSAYSAAKAGVLGFTKTLAKEVATKGIIVNAVTPAVIETEILAQLDEVAVGYMLQRVPMGRPGKSAEVAALVSWLSSDECSFTTGAVVDISGGRATY